MRNDFVNYIVNGEAIFHADRKNHKYIAKSETSKGTRYFYSQAEYDAFLKAKEKGMSDEEAEAYAKTSAGLDKAEKAFKDEMSFEKKKASQLADWAKNSTTSAANSARDRVTKEAAAEREKASQLANWAKNTTKNSVSNAKNSAAQAKKNATDYVSKEMAAEKKNAGNLVNFVKSKTDSSTGSVKGTVNAGIDFIKKHLG